MEFERIKLINEFKTVPRSPDQDGKKSPAAESGKKSPAAEKEDSGPIYVDYM